MTAPLLHRKHTIENAARMARDLNLVVRLEVDGGITFIPDIHSQTTFIDGKKVSFIHAIPAIHSLTTVDENDVIDL